MFFPFMCNNCRSSNPQEYCDDGLYKNECSHCGAKNAHSIRQHRFETLFDFGALAFLDGYYRESVANFASSLERFFEFFIKIIWLSDGIDLDTDLALNTWNLVSKQSERQLGSFITMYAMRFRESPDFLKPSSLQSEFRNKVIHNGYIPSLQETEKYASMVYSLVKTLLIKLCDSAGSATAIFVEKIQSKPHIRWAEANGYTYSMFCYDGMFGIGRFSPFALYLERERNNNQNYPEHVKQALRVDLGFAETLKARRVFLEALRTKQIEVK